MFSVFLSPLLWISLVIFISFPTDAKIKVNQSSLDDGPYVSIENDELFFRWVCRNKISQLIILQSDLPYNYNQCQISTVVDRSNFLPDDIVYQGDFPVAAISDFHGQYELMMTLLTNNQIVDMNGNWAFGNGHFVITGDVFDRGDKVTEILWFLYHLEQQAEKYIYY